MAKPFDGRPLDEVLIENLNLGISPRHLLDSWGVKSVEQLLSKNENEMRERFSRLVAKRYANKYVDEIIRELNRHCLSLSP
jgi:hypothetical protein